MDPHLVVRARGALLGLVVGNQLGVPTEGKDAQAIREAFPQGVRDLAPPPKGSPFDDDAAMTLLLADSLAEKGDFDAEDVALYNQLCREYFSEPFPARTTITNCLPPALRFEIEAVAVRRSA